MSDLENFDNVVGVSKISEGKFLRFRKKIAAFFYKDTAYIRHWDKEFFSNTAQELIANNTQDSFIIETSRKLLVQQRIIDDTKARRRLERWARNTIICYLMTVFALVVLNGVSRIVWPDVFSRHGFISDTVMTVILSTTTINIIGLGVIVLRGHFPSYGPDEESAKQPHP